MKVFVYAGLVLAMGCYSYREVASIAPTQVRPTVRLQLTDEGRIAVRPMAGSGVDQVEGILDSVSGTTYALRVSSVRRDNTSEHWTGEPLFIPAAVVSRLEVRKFDTFKSVGLAAGLVALGTTLSLGGFESLPTGSRGGGGSTSGR